RRISAAAAGDTNPNRTEAPTSARAIPLRRMAFLRPGCRSFYFGRRPTLCGGLDLGNAAVPVEDLFAVPVQHAFVLVHVVVDLLEIFDPVWLAADVRVDRERAEFRALGAFGVETVELVLHQLQQIVAVVMLN